MLLFRVLVEDPQRWRYGYELSKQTGLASGTLYPILMRLADQRLLETGWEPAEEPGRPPRHIYRLTGDGFALAGQRLNARSEVERPRSARPARATGGAA